jgi:tetratricopeptide (TPR) repeat protein
MANAAELLFFDKQRHQAGDLSGAEQIYRQVLQAEPARGEALGLLALACHQRGDLREAAAWYERALAVQPGDAEAHFRLGMVLMGLSRSDEAAAHFQEAVRLRPDAPEPWNNLGNVLFLKGKTVEAIRCYREAVRLRPDYAEACLNLGNSLREDDRVAEGLKWYREAVRLRPDYPKSHMNLAAALLETGDTREAETHLRECLRLSPGSGKVLSTLIANDLYADNDPGPEAIHDLLANPRLAAIDKAHLHFTLARLLDRGDQPDEAFRHYRETNRIRRELGRQTGETFDVTEHRRLVDRLIAFFTPEWFERVRAFGADTEVPVFVVGMPRSGSSLVEQILTHHPEVAGVGELRDLPRTVDGLAARLGSAEAYPECLAGVEERTIRLLADEYLARVQDLAGPARRITDKMLVNFLHIGFIATLFPQSRVIHCRRDPLDTCVSCFMQIFRGLSFTLDLEDLGSYYREYERLMAHWRALRPLPMLEVAYEDLVADVAGVSRRLVEFCGLPWDERCLRFYENPRTVRTVSKLQVRQPVYKSSVERWRRYGSQLAPLRKALGLAEVDEAARSPKG